MDEALKRLLEAEYQADAEVARASVERERTIQEALDQARRAEAQFVAGIAELQGPYLSQAEERAATGDQRAPQEIRRARPRTSGAGGGTRVGGSRSRARRAARP